MKDLKVKVLHENNCFRAFSAYNYEIWRPADFDETKKYPLLIHV